MNIALFYPRNSYAGWYSLGGYTAALQSLGHTVIDVWLPGNNVVIDDALRQRLPSIEELSRCDAILVAYAEYVAPWLQEAYGLDAWRAIAVPKVLRFDESFDRVDLRGMMNFPYLKQWGDHFSFPAAQDAARYGGTFLPFGTDESVFYPARETQKKYGLGFIGTMYRSRQEYANILARHLEGIPFHGGPVFINDLSGTPAIGYELRQTQLYAQNLREIKVFFCLPPMSQLVVAKVFEVLGCETFLMYPRLEGEGAKNLGVLSDNVDLVYYRLYDYADNARQIRYFLEHEDEREAIAQAGARTVALNFSLRDMMKRMLEPIALRQAAA